ncbi:MAG: peptidase S41, partial [Bacteroidales bacterium]|nr:peptidase S41 [Bacteroidales bacterium]
RDSTGRATRVTDSLRTAYKTKGGRTVYDGYGIEPDITIEPEYAGNIVFALFSKSLPFDFATEFVKKNPSIPPAKDFKITDEIYSDFVDFLQDKDYSYTTLAEEEMKLLIEDAKKEKYDSTIIAQFENLQKQITKDKENDLYKYKEDISELLLSEIVVRYYNQKGRVEAMIQGDKEVLKAVELLNSEEKYKDVFKVK